MRRGVALFLSTLSLRRATSSQRLSALQLFQFLSTLSLRRATHVRNTLQYCGNYFYPRSPCGERRYLIAVSHPHGAISIHALLAESDLPLLTVILRLVNFYPRSPCGERPPLADGAQARATFLSTLSLRRATRHWQTGQSRTRHFYPRSPCGERPVVDVRRATGTADFYPRSPCGERPPKGSDNTGKSQVFLSTLSLRRATIEEVSKYVVKDYFYPRSPCGERRWSMSAAPPARPISIHALLAESDPQPGLYRATHGYFYPRSPCGERPRCIVRPVPGPQISIHALLAESDLPTLAVMLRRS